MNALRRAGLPEPGTGGALGLAVGDFEVVENERRTAAAVALCVDMSYSMAAGGR